ncbi:protein kinase [Corallococcus sp. H22C18031201]|nr:protein kinase [Corallococcus sp. H22C18031201]
MTTSQPKRQPIPFGKYLLLDRVNIGGMAEVWRGKQFGASGFERLVAIKRILPNIAEDEEFISMFIDEAKISVQLTHANIAQIYELGQIATSYFISMEYIPGKDMRAIFDRCRKKGEPAPVPLVAFCVAKMCEGLDYAHRKKDGMGRDLNIVHRDISPQNVLISFEGEVKVIDFGIAKAAGKATKTQAGILKGKFGYMSPEQIRGLPLDRRSDVFAIGVCLYEMLTGERLFVGESDFSVLEKVRKAEVAPPSTYNRRIPEALERIVLKSLAKDVDERYQYASELGDDLQRFLITSDSIFSRKDLMQYMKSTFAEEVEREKQRLAEYADIRPPDGMLAAIEAGFSGPPPPSMTQSMPAMTAAPASPVPVVDPVASPPRSSNPAAPTAPQAVRRAPTLTALPKLTAATAAPPPKADEDLATQMVDRDQVFSDTPEPTTQPGAAVGRAITPLESEATLAGNGDDDENEDKTGKTSVIPPPAPLPPSPPRLTQAPPRSSLTNVPTLAPVDAPPRAGRGGDELPRIVRPESPSEAIRIPPHIARQAASPPRFPPPPRIEEDDPSERTTAQVDAIPGSPRKSLDKRLVFGGAALGVLLLLVAVGFAMRPGAPVQGYVMVELKTTDAKEKAQVSINAQPGEKFPSNGFVLKQVAAGQALIVVSADGFDTVTQTVQVAEGASPTQVKVSLTRQSRSMSLVVSTDPADAEVKIDDKVVRAQGARDMLIKDVQVQGDTLLVQVSAPNHKPFIRRIPVTGVSPLEVSAKLETDGYKVRVDSKPAGATIVIGGKELTTITPAIIQVPPGMRQLTLRLKCFADLDVDLIPPAAGESQATASGSLKRLAGRCH